MFTAKDALYEAMAYTDKKVKGGGGGGVTPVPLTVTENGTYTAEVGQAYNPVTVNVPSPLSSADFYVKITTNNYADVTVIKTVVEDYYFSNKFPSDVNNLTIESTYVSSLAFNGISVNGDVIFSGNTIEIGGFYEGSIAGDLIINNGRKIQTDGFGSSSIGTDHLIISEGIEEIGTNAFNYCVINSGGTVTLPSTLVRISELGINFTDNAEVLNILATTPPELLGSHSLEFLHIYVPAESVDAYKSAEGWSDYASIIEAIPTE